MKAFCSVSYCGWHWVLEDLRSLVLLTEGNMSMETKWNISHGDRGGKGKIFLFTCILYVCYTLFYIYLHQYILVMCHIPYILLTLNSFHIWTKIFHKQKKVNKNLFYIQWFSDWRFRIISQLQSISEFLLQPMSVVIYL